MANNESDNVKIGILGPGHTFTDQAADLFIANNIKNDSKKILYSSIWEVFDALKKNEINRGIVPVENTIHGTIRESYDALFDTDLKIIHKFSLPIHHCFSVKNGTKKRNIKKIASHNQVINQCRKYLRMNYPDSQLISFSSTAEAIHNCLADADFNKAVICSREAAQSYSLDIVDENIEDRKGNKTWFTVLSNLKNEHIPKNAGNIQTSIAFHFKKDHPGTLYGVFEAFKDAKVNMTKIESRPTLPKWGNYIFFLDFEGDMNTPKIDKLLKLIEKRVALLKNFGSYIVK